MKNTQRHLSAVLELMMILLVITVTSIPITSFAASGSRTYKASGKMDILLPVGSTKDSPEVTIKVSDLPDNAVITKLTVKGGTASGKGGILTNYLIVRNSHNRSERIAWNGQTNRDIVTSAFLASPANGTYKLSFNATALSGYFERGVQVPYAYKEYNRPSITIYWSDAFNQ